MKKSNQNTPETNILYSCVSKKERSTEHFIEVHAVGYVVAGELHFVTKDGKQEVKTGTLGLAKRNQLIKASKIPPSDGEFRSINILLYPEILKRYSLEHGISARQRPPEEVFYEIPSDPVVKGFFSSLTPYFETPERLTPSLAELKTKEIIELLLTVNPALKNVLFDFSEPHKIDLEAFMQKNFMFNVSIDTMAKLTGRSRAGFKRDFEKTFGKSPGQWLKERRLQEAYHLIKYRGVKPSEAYLDVGFENLSHFSYAFKQAYGVNPSTV
jgi:AraC-like DNA-binding protein